MKRFILLTIFLAYSSPAYSVIYTWDLATGGSWEVPTNWNPNSDYPHVAGDEASLLNTLSAPSTITISAPLTIDVLAFDSTRAYTVSGASTISFANSRTIYAKGSGITHIIQNPVTGASTYTVDTNSTLNISGALTPLVGFVKDGIGTLILSGTNTYGVVTTTIDAGIIRTGSTGGLSPNSVVLINAGGTLEVLHNSTILNLSMGASGTLDFKTSGAILTFGNDTDQTVSGTIQGTGSLVKQGTGISTFAGTSTYTGSTAINNGTISTGATNSLPTGTDVSIETTGKLQINHDTAINSLSSSFSGAELVFTGSALLSTGGSSDTTYNGTIAGIGSMTKTGSGIFTLGGNNSTWDGVVNISEGTIRTGSTNTFAPSNSLSIFPNATLEVLNNIEILGLSSGGFIDFKTSGATLTYNDPSFLNSISGTVQGSGSVIFNGTGKSHYTGTCTYSGSTTIGGGGTIATGATNALSANSTYIVETGTLEINDPTQIGSLESSGLAGVVNIFAPGVLTVGTNNATTTYHGTIAEDGSLIKSGSGSLVFSDTICTYTGNTTVLSGTLQSTTVNALAQTSAFTIDNAELRLGDSQTLASLASTSNLAVLSIKNTLTTGGDNSSTEYSGLIQGFGTPGNLTKIGTGTMTLSGSGTHSGTTTISNGVLATGSTTALSPDSLVSIAGGTLRVLNNSTVKNFELTSGTLDFQSANAALTFGDSLSYSINGTIQGTGNLVKEGTGTSTFGGTCTYTGDTNIFDGTISTGAADALSHNSDFRVETGDLLIQHDTTIKAFLSDPGNTSGLITISLGTTLTAGDSADRSYSGTLAGLGAFTKTGSGTLTFRNVCSNSGNTTILAGALTTSADNLLFSNSTYFVNGGSLDANFNSTIGGLASSGSSGVVNLALGKTLTAGGNDISTAYSGTIQGSGALTKTGTGILTFSGTSTYSGQTIIDDGTVSTGAANPLSPSSDFLVNNSSVLNINHNSAIGSLGSTSLSTGIVNIAPGITLTAGSSGASSDYYSTIQGVGSFAKTGTGTLTFHNTGFSYTGTTTVSNGTLSTGNALALPTASDFLVNGDGVENGILDINFDTTIKSLGSSPLLPFGTVDIASSRTLTTGLGNASSAYYGTIQGGGGLTKIGTGTMTFAGTSTYSGGTTISAGAITTGGVNPLSPNSIHLVVTTLNILNDSAIGPLAVGASGTVDFMASGATLTINQTSIPIADVLGTIQGDGNLVVQESNRIIFANSGGSTYTGTTTITNGGSIRTNAVNALAQTSDFILDGSAGLDIRNNTVIGSLGSLNAGSTTVFLNSPAILTVGNNNASTTYAGRIVLDGALTKIGTGTLTLAGTCTYSGLTTLSAGAISTGAANALSPDSTVILENATLNINHDAEIGGIGAIIPSGTVNLASGATLTTGRNSVFSQYRASMHGAGGLTKTGSGNLDFEFGATCDYSGRTTILDGFLRGTSNNTLSANSSYFVNNGELNILFNNTIGSLGSTGSSGTVNISGVSLLTAGGDNTDTTYSGVITGFGGAFTKVGTGSLTLTGNNTYTGTTTLNDGTLINNGHIDSSDTVVNAGTLGGNGSFKSIDMLGGTISPGNSIGTIEILGNYHQASGVVYLLEIDAAQSDVIHATGTGTIDAGAILTLEPTVNFTLHHPYDILVADGGLNVLWSEVNISNHFDYDLELIGGTTARLTLNNYTLFVDGAVNPGNTLAVNNYMKCLILNGEVTLDSDLMAVIESLDTLDNYHLNNALNLLHPGQFGAFEFENLDVNAYISSVIGRQINPFPCYGETCCYGYKNTFWASVIGSFTDIAHYSEMRGYHTGTGGVIFGYDHCLFNHGLVGVALGYNHTDLDWRGGAGNTEINAYLASIYSGFAINHFTLDLSLLGGVNNYDVTRTLNFANIHRKAQNQHKGYFLSPHLELRSDVMLGSTSINFIGVGDYFYLHQPTYTEHGADSLNLSVESKNSQMMRFQLGAGIAKNYTMGRAEAEPYLNLSWVNKIVLSGGTYTSKYKEYSNSNCTLKVETFKHGKSFLSPEAGVSYFLEPIKATVAYRGEFARSYMVNQFDIKVEWNF